MLVDVARQLFARMGVDNTTMNDIAQASRKGRRTLYTYFKSKNEIYLAVVESELDQLHKMLVDVASKDLPADKFPSRITKDNAGNLLICYVGGLTFNGTGGGIYKYNTTTGEVTNISPTENSFGACMANPNNNDQLIATTCGVWSTNSWSKEDGAWGDWLYRSEDGGKTWTEYYPGKM